MRLNINLATNPYQDLGRYLRRWVLPLVVFGVASIALAFWAWHQYSANRGMNEKIKAQQEQIQQFDQQKVAATKMLTDPSNKEVADTARFLNLLIAKKAFSWTRVFMQMEQILPTRLHMISLTPDLTSNNQLQLTMRVAGNSRDEAVELVRRIEKSPSFRSPVLRAETMLPPDQARDGDSVMFEISAVYVPTMAPAAKQVTAGPKSESAADGKSSDSTIATSKGAKR